MGGSPSADLNEKGTAPSSYAPAPSQGVQAQWFDIRGSTLPGAGRGVFCKRSFRAGQIVMQAPILLYNKDEVAPGSRISQYQGSFHHKAFLCFDYQGLVNTASCGADNNVRAQWRIGEEISQYVALRDIGVGEELLQAYSEPEVLN